MVRHHSTLQPLKIRPDTPITNPGRRNSSHSAGSSSRLTVPLPSPTIVAARAYYRELGTPIGLKSDALQRRRSLIEEYSLLRRHSILPINGNLASQLECFSFGAAKCGLRRSVEDVKGDREAPQIEEQEHQPIMATGVKRAALHLATEAALEKSELACGTNQEVLGQVPFEYTHERLRDWGLAYLGNELTADALVNAVGLKRPCLALAQEEQYQLRLNGLVTIRARITPRAKERKPFLIQRQFDIDELRASIPEVQTRQEVGDFRSTSSRTLRRSSRARRQCVQPAAEVSRRRASLDAHQYARHSSLGEAAIPIRKPFTLNDTSQS